MKCKLLTILSIAIAILAITSIWCTKNKNDLIVKIANGNLRGRDNGYYYSYESIPYAQAPVGDLRFEAPVPYRQKWDKEFDATEKSQPCLQWNQFEEGENKLTGIEDCLTVNIYKPKSNHSNYPVMVYLHGGCFMFGDVNLYSHDLLMKNGNIMLVKVVYRLGPLGFLSTEDEIIPGNFGLKDQQLALKWIKENIAHFGGDPEKIMLTGFSAGGASTHYHVLNPQLQNLVKTAVSFSGVALNPWALIKGARKNAFKLASILKCPETQDTHKIKLCLQNKSAEDIVSTVKYFLNFGYNPFTTFGPVVEHKNAPQAFLTQQPKDIIKSGNFSHIPWLASYTKEDGGYNAAELLQINPKTGREYVYDLNEHWLALAPKNLFLQNILDRPQDYAKELKRKYMGENAFSVDNYLRIQEMYTDVLFKNGVVAALNLHRQHGQAPVYGYVYDNPADYCLGYAMTQRKDIEFGSNHLDDLSLILNYEAVRSPLRPDEVRISEKLIQMLVDFVETEQLTFGDCEFEVNNGESSELKVLSINRDDCQSINLS